MFVAATTDCYENQPLDFVFDKLSHLEFANVELAIREGSKHLTPQQVRDEFDATCNRCQSTKRLTISGFFFDLTTKHPEYIELFTACCKLAKATKVVTISVASGDHDTYFNEEVERCKQLVKIAEQHGVRVGLRTQVGHLSDDPDKVSVFCKHVKGLGLSLDPSHYIYGRGEDVDYDHLLEYVHNVTLRDSTKDDLQVRIGQGVVEYGKLINTLRKMGYDRALCVDIQAQPDVDHDGELRKLRLLLESLLFC